MKITGVFFLHQDLYKTAIEFLKLEKIELGGVRGNILGSMVTQIYDEVFELVKVFAECKYDPLDPGDSVSRARPHLDPWWMLQELGGTWRECWSRSKDVTEISPRGVPTTMSSILRGSPQTCQRGQGLGLGSGSE